MKTFVNCQEHIIKLQGAAAHVNNSSAAAAAGLLQAEFCVGMGACEHSNIPAANVPTV